jgi:hypothetical protein
MPIHIACVAQRSNTMRVAKKLDLLPDSRSWHDGAKLLGADVRVHTPIIIVISSSSVHRELQSSENEPRI